MLSCPGRLWHTHAESKTLGNISNTFEYTFLAQAAQVDLVEHRNDKQ